VKKGGFVLSLDFELAWGSFSTGKVQARKILFEKCREVIKALLNLLEKYEISATWDVVGHLFLDHCAPVDGVVHPEIVRPHYKWFSGDWFKYDPCTNIEENPIWYGKDIIDTIRRCKIPQEIACHTFSHIIVGDPACSKSCFDSDLKLCKKIAGDINLELKSFVYPQNKEGYHDVLSANGFIAYRGREPYYYAGLPEPIRKVAYVIDSWMFFIPPPVRKPYRLGDCWNISGSYFYGHLCNLNKLIPVPLRVLKIKRGIDKAARRRQIFHLWLHPFNLSSGPSRLLGGLEETFRYFNRIKKDGYIENLTMREAAEKMTVETCSE